MFIQSYVNSNLNLSTLFIFLWILVIRVDTCKFKKKGGGGNSVPRAPMGQTSTRRKMFEYRHLTLDKKNPKSMVNKCQFTLLILHIDNFLYFLSWTVWIFVY